MKRCNAYKCCLWVAAAVILILFPKIAFHGASDGIKVCISSVIPSLFPFLVISNILNRELTARSIPLLRPISKICNVPKGCESILLLGLIGGYPVGAQAVKDAYQNGSVNYHQAKRLLGFCNNAGPAFIFGILPSQFSSIKTVWIIWFIHMLSAIIVGIILPEKEKSAHKLSVPESMTLAKAVESSVRIASIICGWVIIFRVVISYIQAGLPEIITAKYISVFSGILELTNGCMELSTIKCEATRFIICCCILSFGGLCVAMQTNSVAKGLGISTYLQGKTLQAMISYILAVAVRYPLYEQAIRLDNHVILGIIFSAIITFIFLQKSSRFMNKSIVE